MIHRLLLLPVIAAVFFVDSCAFAATMRGTRANATGTNVSESTTQSAQKSVNSENQTTANAPVTARAANRDRVRTTNTNNTTTARVAARVAAKAPGTSVDTNVSQARVRQVQESQQSSAAVAARAATKQKAVNFGTKIKTKTENSGVPQDCHDAYFGCMDSFCMMDNTSGGRCRCDDRSAELDKVLDELINIDSKSKSLAEQGVARLKMGKDVDAVEKMVAETENAIMGDLDSQDQSFSSILSDKKSENLLDFSDFNIELFDTDDLFSDIETESLLTSDFSDKTGNDLRAAATRLCLEQVSGQCHQHADMLQLLYANEIKSNCIGYENELKQRYMNSQELQKTAKKAVRDAALERYKADNKYTKGECVLEFKKCMVEEDKCGSGYANCVVNPVLLEQSTKSGKKSSAKPKTISTGTTVIEIESATYDRLEAFKEFCEPVLDQCVNERDNVWGAFLRTFSAELKAAEMQAEADRLQSCASNVLNCIKTAARNAGNEEGTEAWDYFTSNTKLVDYTCKPYIDQCAVDNPDMATAVVEYVKRYLDAQRVDNCTKTVRKCYQDACGGSDYHLCVGLSPKNLVAMCSMDAVRNACMGHVQDGTVESAEAYIGRIGYSLVVEINDALVKRCQEAVDDAMTEVCYGTDSCTSDSIDFSSLWQQYLKYQVCSDKSNKKCIDDVALLSDWQVEDPTSTWHVVVSPVVKPSDFTFDYYAYGNNGVISWSGSNAGGAKARVTNVVDETFKTLLSRVESDGTVESCIHGNVLEGLDGVGINNKKETPAFTNLTNNVRGIIGQSIYNKFVSQYADRLEEVMDAAAEANVTITAKYAQTESEREKACKDLAEDGTTEGSVIITKTSSYYSNTSTCRVVTTKQYCKDPNDSGGCDEWDTGKGVQQFVKYFNMKTGKICGEIDIKNENNRTVACN